MRRRPRSDLVCAAAPPAATNNGRWPLTFFFVPPRAPSASALVNGALTTTRHRNPYIMATLACQGGPAKAGAGCSPMSPHHRYEQHCGGGLVRQLLGGRRAVLKEFPR